MPQRPRSRASSANNNETNDGNGGSVATADAPEKEGRDPGHREEGFLNLADLKEMSISKLTSIAKGMDVPGATGMRKQELIFKVLAAQTEKSGLIFSEGVLETCPTASASCERRNTTTFPARTTSMFRRRRFASSTCAPGIRSAVRFGHLKKANVTFALIKVEAINFESPDQAREKVFFDNLTPLYPEEQAEDGSYT